MLFLQKLKNCDNSIVRMLSTSDMCVGKLMSNIPCKIFVLQL